MITKEESLNILDKLEFFQGQRAGRELCSDKPDDVQDEDLADFVCDIQRLREFIGGPQTGTGGATIFVPLEAYEKYLTSNQWALYKFDLECRISNAGNKARYRKFAKKLKKAIKFLPNNLEVIVRCKK